VLRSDDETRAIAIGLTSGEELQEHQVHERTYLLVADGEIEISQDGNSVTGATGFLPHFEPNERRTVRALSGLARRFAHVSLGVLSGGEGRGPGVGLC
jgi:quercetin dioxygenase-like cupin family protein